MRNFQGIPEDEISCHAMGISEIKIQETKKKKKEKGGRIITQMR